MSDQIKTIVIDETKAKERLDLFLMKELNISRTQAKILIRDDYVKVNDTLKKSSHIVRLGEIISIVMPDIFEEATPENIPLNIVYEDKDIIVVNKSADMVVHIAPGNSLGTLVNALLYHCGKLSNFGKPLRPGIVHRLDKGTSGLLVVAKTDDAYSKLIKQIMDRKFARKYIAIVEGVIEENDGIIDAPIGRSTSDRKRLAVTSGKSKIAITKFKVLERFAEHTLLEVELQTGRTHQIRVHMSYLKHPVLGDITYGNPHISLKHQALHAYKLGFFHPQTEKYIEFTAPIPEDISNVLAEIKIAKFGL